MLGDPMKVPDTLRAGLARYADYHIETGGFLRAVLENDLEQAVARADPTNFLYLPAIVAYLYAALPRECWGSPAIVRAWLQPRPGDPEFPVPIDSDVPPG